MTLKQLTDRMALQKDQQQFKDEQAKAKSYLDAAEIEQKGLILRQPDDPVF